MQEIYKLPLAFQVEKPVLGLSDLPYLIWPNKTDSAHHPISSFPQALGISMAQAGKSPASTSYTLRDQTTR